MKTKKEKTEPTKVAKEENSVKILPPRQDRPAALFWDVYRNTPPSDNGR